ncbi:MAG TPA: competence/damage-inducible protein A [Gemmatimonadaceae bacterium]|nr:competence/damage-inducible protein A [Gemmatimonadaceae bacterium]
MNIELITIGDELLLGFTVDTNGAYLARKLAEIGVRVVRRSTAGDAAEGIATAVREALDRTGAVITTGGLGPTADDLTKPSIAALFGRSMYLDEKLVEWLEARFRELGYKGGMPRPNIQQAMIPEGARILHNRHGSAPGIWLEDEHGRWVAMLPGVPREMRGMTDDTIVPLLRERVGEGSDVVLSRTLRTTGIGESALAERLGDLARDVDGLSVAYLPGWEGADLRLTVRAPRDVAERLIGSAADRLRERAEPYVYGRDGTDLAALVLDLCRARHLTLGAAESCTGGMLGARITAVPGSSDVFLGGIVAYDNGVKTRLLDVDPQLIEQHGAVSEEVASAMAAGVGARLGCDVGIGITGIAGPDGGTPEKPVGTVWIAVQFPWAARTLGRRYIGDREEIRMRACQAALDIVRREVQGR